MQVERVTEHKRLTTKEKYPHGAEGVSNDTEWETDCVKGKEWN